MDHLPAQEVRHVTSLLSGLFLYVYRTKNKKAKVTVDNTEHLCHVGSTIVFRSEQSSRRLISQYLKLYPQLSKEDAACITRFQDCRKQQLHVVMYEQEYALAVSRRGRTLYGIKGITNSSNLLLRNQALPCMMQHAILSYKNRFIFDGIGNVQVIADLSFVVGFSEKYRSIAMGEGALFPGHEIAPFSVLECNMQEKGEEFFSDYLSPLNAILWNTGQDQKNSFLEPAPTAWNLSYGSDKQAEELFPRDIPRRYVKPLTKCRRAALANVRFLIDCLEAPLEGETCIKVVGRKKAKQLELKL